MEVNKKVGSFLKGAVWWGEFCVFEVWKGQRAKVDTSARVKGRVARKRKALSSRADISCATRLYETFSGDPIILLRNNEDKGPLYVRIQLWILWINIFILKIDRENANFSHFHAQKITL